jgi:hypothetical protein
MDRYPIARSCPACGSAAFKRVRPEKGRIAFTDDRKCQTCGTRYTPPTPTWAAVLFIACGGFLLLVWGLFLVLAVVNLARGVPPWSSVLFIGLGTPLLVPPGILCVRYGLRCLKSQPAEPGPTKRPEVGSVATPNAGPPNDGFTGRAAVNE